MKSKPLSTALSVVFFIGLIFGLTQVFSGRGAFITTGAIFGSMMLLNVWVRILPGQGKMLREAQAGRVPDYTVSAKSKTRSVHNTYFIFPVLFIMLSNHYPLVYNHPRNWLLLIVLSVSGALTRHAMVTKSPKERWTLVPAALGFLALVFWTAVPADLAPTGEGRVTYGTIRQIFDNRCLRCHSTHPTDEVYKTAPNGVIFETEEQIRSKAEKVHLQAILAKTMPLANKTGMTEAERSLVSRWLKQEGLVH